MTAKTDARTERQAEEKRGGGCIIAWLDCDQAHICGGRGVAVERERERGEERFW